MWGIIVFCWLIAHGYRIQELQEKVARLEKELEKRKRDEAY